MTKLNVGCGRSALAGWLNLDRIALPGVDLIADLDDCATTPLPIASDSVDEFLLSHVLEHLAHPLPLLEELWRCATANARLTIRVPHGANDEAWEDPTHVRSYFASSFGYFSQPNYWRADYGYRGDWQPNRITLRVPGAGNRDRSAQEILDRVNSQRNIVREMVAELVCIKPARPPLRELQVPPSLHIELV